MKFVKFSDIFDFQKKSQIKAGDGLSVGSSPFFTSSTLLSKYLNSFQFDSPSLIFGTGGNPSIHICEVPFSVSTDCLVAQLKLDLLGKYDIKFVYYYLFGNIWILERGFKGAGLKHISKGYINDIDIPDLPISTQKRVVKILDQTSILRVKRKQAINLLDNYLESVFVEMFGNIKSKKIKHEWGTIRQFVHAESGKSSKEVLSDSKTEIPVYGGNGINGWAKLPLYTKPVVIAGRVGQQCGVIHLSDGPCWVTDNAIVLTIEDNDKLDITYLADAFRHSPLRKTVEHLDLPFINQSILLDTPIPFPDIKLQKKYATIVHKKEKLKREMIIQYQELDLQFKALVQKAFKGEL